MKKIKELKYTDLEIKVNKSEFKFKSTDDISSYNGIIGQARALETVKEAIEMPQKGFNLFVSGQVGMGKTPYVMSVVNSVAKLNDVPEDLCYVHNFDIPNEPVAIFFKAGDGRIFYEDICKYINTLRDRLVKTFNEDDFKAKRKIIISEYETKKSEIMKKFDSYAASLGFKVKIAPDGIYFSPIFEGKVLNEKEFNELADNIKDTFKSKSAKIHEDTKEVMNKLAVIEKECSDKVNNWQYNLVTYMVSNGINDLKVKYKGNIKIQNFLYSMQQDIINNIEVLKQSEGIDINQNPNLRAQTRPWDKYKVNLLVNNENLKHAPVVLCTNPNYYDLFGKLEYENQLGVLKTDHTMLKAGLFHKANGGFLLVNARDLLTNMTIWEAFKRVIRNSELSIDSSRDISAPVTMISLKPEAIHINTQVILFGNEAIYQQLSSVDPDFKKLFKMKADFDFSIDKNLTTTKHTIEYIAYVTRKESLLPFNVDAVKEIIKYSSRCAGDKTKLTAMQVDITDIIIESAYIAKNDNKKQVTKDDVLHAISNKRKRYGKYDDNLKQMIEDGSIMISTSGFEVGKINGLTVIVGGDASFGKPVRITANTYLGKSGIINIEREVSMSGTSHSKGVYILSAYLGERFAQDFPLTLNASICFEQLYNGVDGDSASSTELYAILSSLSNIPINQGIAVTGSVNQKGEIQPIGGVTDKVEGFFEVCKMKGLTGTQGVIMPEQNVKNLVLSDEIIEAVKEEKFHIYPVSNVSQGIEILTNVKYGSYDREKGFEKGSISYFVYEKLKKYALSSSNYSRD